MVKSASSKAERKRTPKRKPSKPRWHVRYWPALIGGVLLLGLVAILWQQVSRAAFGNELIEKLPRDSYLAGVAKLSQFDFDSIKQTAASTGIEAAEAGTLIDLLSRYQVSPEQLRDAFGDQFGFAKSKRGDVAVFTIKDADEFSAMVEKVKQESADSKQVDQKVADRTLKIWQGTLQNPTQSIAAYRDGTTFIIGTSPEAVAAASQEKDGFTGQQFFSEVSNSLPPGRDAYVFLNASQAPQPPAAVPPLTGVAINNEGDTLKLTAFTADTPAVPADLPQTDGSLLPNPAAAPMALEGRDVSEYFQLLQEQRQESDLPKVIRLQNGLASVNRTLGLNVDSDFFGKATGKFVYARYRNQAGGTEWFGAVEFGSESEAASAVTDMTKRLRERVTVPVRRERLRNLPDGTQSREIVSEGREALEIGNISVEGRAGNQTVFPSLGNVSWVVDGKYLVLASSAEAAARMTQTIAKPTTKLDDSGQLAIQVKLTDVPALTGSRDGLFDWILSTRAQSGDFILTKQTGELKGAVRFNQGGS